MRCMHENTDDTAIRRFRYSGGSYFALQCPDCLRRVGRKLEASELDVHPREIRWAEKKRGKTGLGGNGNSKRLNYEARFRQSDWKRLRARVLDRDDFTCRNCGEAADQVHHLTYERFWKERLSDLAASCAECNQAERQQRIAGGA
ncbi:MAG: hypothetical protein NXI30_04415 [bacterium]|nr:hypothetical protein [bacterium]